MRLPTGKPSPGGRMPDSWSAKRERQYEHIKDSEKKQGRSTGRAKEIAARTVNKQRSSSGETKSSSRSSSSSSSRSSGARKTTGRKTTARKTTARKTTARKTAARKTTARRAPAKRTTA